MEDIVLQDDWVLMDFENTYVYTWYGGYDEDPSLPYKTDDLREAVGYPDREAAETQASKIYDRHQRDFSAFRRREYEPVMEDGALTFRFIPSPPQPRGEELTFYCPVYEGQVDEYDCNEISSGIYWGSYTYDGIPYLMDLDLALSRRTRCDACPRSRDHSRPDNVPLLTALKHLGFPGDYRAAEEALKQAVARFGEKHQDYQQGRVRYIQLPSGIQIWMQWDTRNDCPYDYQVSFMSANAMYLRQERLLRHRDAGRMLQSLFIANAHGSARQRNRLINNAFTSPNLSLFKDAFAQKGSYVAQVCAFPRDLRCFESVASYLAQREDRLAEESFVSGLAAESFVSGLAAPDADEERPLPTAAMSGVVVSVARVVNDLTDQPFYHMGLRCLGRVFDVVAAPELFEREPAVGQVLRGEFWLSARIIEYGYSGYEFEVDVSAPLTSPRFEPLRCAILNLQPGERLYCGIDPPMFGITFVRAKGEVEGISVEFRLDSQEEDADQEDWRILRFYPVSKEEAVRIFERSLVRLDPPCLDEARDVSAEYREMKAVKKGEK